MAKFEIVGCTTFIEAQMWIFAEAFEYFSLQDEI